MTLKFQWWLLLFVAKASVAVWQHITLKEGQTLTLKCPIKSAHKSHVEWKNPFGYVMFFNGNKALKDKRYSIVNLSNKEFTVNVSEVTFKDGGLYTCFQYNHEVIKQVVKVTVIGEPKLEVTKQAGKTIIRCTGEGNNHPPRIYWNLGNGFEIAAKPQYIYENRTKKYSSMDTIHVQSLKKRVRVKCIIRHPDLHMAEFMNFINIGPNSKKITSTKSPPPYNLGGPTELQKTTTPYMSLAEITKGKIITATHSRDPTTKGPTKISTVSLTASQPLGPSTVRYATSPTGPHLNPTTGHSETLRSEKTQTKSHNEIIRNSTNTAAFSSESVTRNNQISNGTEGIVNSTKVFFNEIERQRTNGGSSQLLVFLVTCLIFTLLVVVIFLSVRLRRAHILWKKENEDSEQSEESSKSKSSHEEKQSQQQRRKGLFNIGFTQYVIEEPKETQTTEPTNTSLHTTISPSSKEVVAQESQFISPTNSMDKTPHVKETEL